MNSEPDWAMTLNNSGSYFGSEADDDTEDNPNIADESLDESDEDSNCDAVANVDVFVNGSENNESLNNISVIEVNSVGLTNRSLICKYANNLMDISESEKGGICKIK